MSSPILSLVVRDQIGFDSHADTLSARRTGERWSGERVQPTAYGQSGIRSVDNHPAAAVPQPTEHVMRLVEPTIPTLLARMNAALSEMERKDFRTDQATVDVHLAALEISVTAMGPHGNLLLPLIEFMRQAQIAGDGTLSFAAFTEHII